jgi:hypothetical protein
MADVAISGLPGPLVPVPSTALVPLVDDGATKRGTVAEVVKGGGALLKDGSVAATGNLSMGTRKITGLGNGSTGTQEAATVAQTEALIAAAVAAAISTLADWKQSVRAATTANITLSGAQTIDGVSVVASDRVLVKNQSTASQNGLYVAASGAWSRSTDADANTEITTGLTVAVEEGTANGPGGTGGGNVFMLTTAGAIVVGTTSLTFTRLGTAQSDGTSLELSGGVWRRAALTGDVTAPAGSNTLTIPNDTVTFAKMLNATAADKVVGSTTAGDFVELGLTHGVERSGTNLLVSSQLPARGTENVIVDLMPSTQQQGTIANSATVNIDVAIASGKRYKISADVWVDDGAGGTVLFTRTLLVNAHQTGGAAVKVSDSVVEDNGGSGFTFTAAANSTNIRFSLANTSGSTRSYNVLIGYIAADKP